MLTFLLYAFFAAIAAGMLIPRDEELLIGEILHRRKEYPAAITEWGVAASKYAGTKWASAAMFRIGSVYEKDLGDLPKAIEEYEKLVKRYPASGEARAVGQLLAQFRLRDQNNLQQFLFRSFKIRQQA